jgi:hypothetical protein
VIPPGGDDATAAVTPTIPATRKASEHSDFSVCTTWAVKGKDLFLDDRGQLFLDEQPS